MIRRERTLNNQTYRNLRTLVPDVFNLLRWGMAVPHIVDESRPNGGESQYKRKSSPARESGRRP